MASRSEPEFAPGPGFAALTHAVLALTTPGPDEGAWRQRAVEAEAALTAIGGVLSEFGPRGSVTKGVLGDIERILRVSGQQSDRLMTQGSAPAGYPSAPGYAGLTPADVDALVITAGELADAYGTGDDLDPSDILSARQREVLDKAARYFRGRGADPSE